MVILPDMVKIPAGEMWLGSDAREMERREDEIMRCVRVEKDFWMSRYPVTNKLFGEFLMDASYKVEYACFNLGDDVLPVVNVSYIDAMAYVQWLSKKTGEHYCLPSEEEWEYAARAGSRTAFHCGESVNESLANFNGQYVYYAREGSYRDTRGIYRQRLTPVGEFPGNAFGLHDVHGNVWEWTRSDWTWIPRNVTRSTSSPVMLESQYCSKVVKGGSWCNGPGMLRCAYRGRYPAHLRLSSVGFRVVCIT